MAREYFCAYHSILESLKPFSDAECGRLFRACLQYSMTGEAEEFRGNERFIWPTLKQMIDRDTAPVQNTVPPAQDLEALYASLGSWDAVAETLGVSRSTLWRMRNECFTTFQNVSPCFTTFHDVSECFTHETFETSETKEKGEKKGEKERSKEKGERKDPKETDPKKEPPKGGKKESPPTLADVRDYVNQSGYIVDAVKFFTHYDNQNWTIRGKPIDDWRKLVDRWEAEDRGRERERQKSVSAGPAGHDAQSGHCAGRYAIHYDA